MCGKEYDVCPTCEESRLNPWRKTVCCAQHYQIRMVYLQYKDGCVTIEQAKEMLDNIGCIDISGLKPGYQEFIKQTQHVVTDNPVTPSVFKKAKKNKSK